MHGKRQRAINVMLGVHLGDALGVPFELMTRRQILEATGGEGVTGPRFDLDPSTRKIPDTRGLAPGSTSDDSQLADATAAGLIMSGTYHHELQVLLHLHALWHDAAGWGGTTMLSLYEIDRWYRARSKKFSASVPPKFKKERDRLLWEKAEPRDPAHRARWREQSRGNGPSMKIAPFGVRYGLLDGYDFGTGLALEEIMTFSRMTHADPICALAAYAVAGVVSDGIAAGAEAAWMRLRPRLAAAEAAYVFNHRGADRFSEALSAAMALVGTPEKLWRFGSEGRSDSMTSVPMALAIWYRHADDVEPTAAVLEAINAGGDTDTVAAMVGAMMGSLSDRPDWWPPDWTASLRDKGTKAARVGGLLHDVATLRRRPEGFDLDEIKRELGYL